MLLPQVGSPPGFYGIGRASSNFQNMGMAAVSCSGGFSDFFALLAVSAGYEPWHRGWSNYSSASFSVGSFCRW